MRNFYGKRYLYFIISAALIIAGIIGLFVNGVKLDITFSGGAKITYSYTGDEISTTKVENVIKNTLNREATVQNSVGYQSDDTSLIISLAGTESLEADEQETLYQSLVKAFPNNNFEQGSTTNVEAAIGHKFLTRGLIAIGIAAVFIIVYVSLRFSVVSGFTAAMTALIALFHDIAMIFFAYVLLQIPINDAFIAVVLTILGYSVNDTLVVFDRIRENKKLSGNKLSIVDLINNSISQSLTRTINTSLMSLAAIVLVLVFGLINGLTSIVNFALPMMIGIISGCYSSSFLAPSLWGMFKNK
jgi:preprotein translocase SecF subunit